MSPSTAPRSSQKSNDPRNLGRWARVYAQNRSLGMVAMMAVALLVFLAIAVPSYFGGIAYRAENWPIFWLWMAVLVAGLAADVYISVPRWGGRLAERLTKRLYAGEGMAQLAAPSTRGRKRIGWVLAVAFGTCIMSSVAAGFFYEIPERYIQPISAIYCIPFLVGLWLLQRPASSPIKLLWPALYGLHAILIVAGAPIVFVGSWSSLNMLIPVAGYGMLVGLVEHAYSRFALRKLRKAAESDLPDNTAGEPRP